MMIKKLLLAAPLALAAGALFATPASAADFGHNRDRQTEVAKANYAGSHDRDGSRYDRNRRDRDGNRYGDNHRDRKDCSRHDYGRWSHDRDHHRWRSERGERHDRR